jgi:hypothetical protein
MKATKIWREWWSCSWGESMSLNCGHQRAYCSFPDGIWVRRATVEWCWEKKTDLSTRALWQLYQRSLLVASRRNGHEFGPVKYFFFHTCRWFLHAVKSYDMGPVALLLPKEGLLRIFVALKIHRLGQVWIRNLGSDEKHSNHFMTEVTWREIEWNVCLKLFLFWGVWKSRSFYAIFRVWLRLVRWALSSCRLRVPLNSWMCATGKLWWLFIHQWPNMYMYLYHGLLSLDMEPSRVHLIATSFRLIFWQ